MKKIIFYTIVALFITTVASAQTNSQAKSEASHKKFIKTANSKKIQLSNRNIYHWTNGQRSTKTGEAATSSNGSAYAALKKDTAAIIKKKKQ